MAGLIKCKACGAAVSKKAPSCPQCGEPLKRKPIGCGSGIGIIVLVLIIGVTINQMSSGPSSIGTSTPTKSPPDSSKVVGGPSRSSNPVASLLFGAGQAERLETLATTVRSSGSPCQKATREMYVGMDQDNSASWSVACSDGGDFMVTVKSDEQGSTSVLECDFLKALNVTCWEKLN